MKKNLLFRGTTDSIITVPEGVKELVSTAIDYNKKLKEIMLPASLEVISECAIVHNDSLEKITLSKDNKHYKVVDGVLFSIDGSELLVYPPQKTDKEYTIPEGVVNVHAFSFSRNKYLEKIVFPDTVVSCGQGIFAACHSLQKVSLSEKLTKINAISFLGCSKITEINIPESVESLGYQSFGDCTSLDKVCFANPFTKIDDYAFETSDFLKKQKISLVLENTKKNMFNFFKENNSKCNIKSTLTWCLS